MCNGKDPNEDDFPADNNEDGVADVEVDENKGEDYKNNITDVDNLADDLTDDRLAHDNIDPPKVTVLGDDVDGPPALIWNGTEWISRSVHEKRDLTNILWPETT